ncbi:FHA domain-containing protein FhaB/FipA [Arenivirga flava]|uniref:FHA domain-containing protein n=1 Tax=Arenivirga flava TaxID=1930060 RepID=A0AA37XD05_9MICO|nr:FHA domain-containing protein [Arenivirga flava]GMA29057.1 FHA domain-containing protein [Arenivirga flava]
MSELTLLVLRIGFLLVLWGFVFAIIYALRSDLLGQRPRRMPAAAGGSPAPVPAPAPARTQAQEPALTEPVSAPVSDALPGRLVITSGAKEGTELDLGRETLTIGRSGDSGLVIRDDYTSTHHARLMVWNEEWVIHDLDSTNGTFLDGRRVTVPTPVPLNTPVKIGTTTFELRR